MLSPKSQKSYSITRVEDKLVKKKILDLRVRWPKAIKLIFVIRWDKKSMILSQSFTFWNIGSVRLGNLLGFYFKEFFESRGGIFGVSFMIFLGFCIAIFWGHV